MRICGTVGLMVVLMTAAVGRAEIATTAPAEVDDAYVKAAKQLERAMKQKDLAGLQTMIDMGGMEKLMMKGINAQKQMIHEHYTIWAGKAPVATHILSERKLGYSYDLINVKNKEGKVQALYRVVSPNGTFWYMACVLSKDENGQIRAVDYYTSSSGEFRSDSLRVYYTRMAADSDARSAAALMGDTDTKPDADTEEHRMVTAYDAGKIEETLSIYDALPPEIQKIKEVSTYRLYAATSLRENDPAGFQIALEDYQKLFANDPCLDTMCFDGWFFEKDYAACYAALDRLEKWTGGDPFLDAVRAKVTLAENGPDAAQAAEKLARAAVAGAPEVMMGHLMLLRSLVIERQFDKAVTSLEEIEKMQGRALPVERMQSMTEFAESDAYKQYREKQDGAATQAVP
jgi:hypothetical protein